METSYNLLNNNGLTRSVQGQVAGYFERSDQPLGSIIMGNFLTSSGTVGFLTRTLRNVGSSLIVMANARIIP
jgi:hypothetical protein